MFDWKMQENEVMNSRILPNDKLGLCSVVSPFQIVLVLSLYLDEIFTFSNKFKLLLLYCCLSLLLSPLLLLLLVFKICQWFISIFSCTLARNKLKSKKIIDIGKIYQ